MFRLYVHQLSAIFNVEFTCLFNSIRCHLKKFGGEINTQVEIVRNTIFKFIRKYASIAFQLIEDLIWISYQRILFVFIIQVLIF